MRREGGIGAPGFRVQVTFEAAASRSMGGERARRSKDGEKASQCELSDEKKIITWQNMVFFYPQTGTIFDKSLAKKGSYGCPPALRMRVLPPSRAIYFRSQFKSYTYILSNIIIKHLFSI